MASLKVSIVTVSYNSINTIADTINSVLAQNYRDIEYIIIDGSSSDGTVELIKTYGSRISKFISEPDAGLYDAINKGIKCATGEVVGILNSDDFFYNNDIIAKIVSEFDKYDTDAVIGDAVFVDQKQTSKVIRYYSSRMFTPDKFRYGFMPAHPSFYVQRVFFEKFGYYKTDYKIGADFELLIRFLYIHKLKFRYLEMPFLSMRMGGVSNKSINNKLILNKEIYRACEENGIKTNYLFLYFKYLIKMFEFFGNNKNESKSHNA